MCLNIQEKRTLDTCQLKKTNHTYQEITISGIHEMCRDLKK